MSILAAALSLITTLIKGWLGSKDVEKNAVKTVIDERNKALHDVKKAKEIRGNIANSPDDGLPDKYQRD